MRTRRPRHGPYRPGKHRCTRLRILNRATFGVNDLYVFWCEEGGHARNVKVEEFWGHDRFVARSVKVARGSAKLP